MKVTERMSDYVNNEDTPSFLAKRQPPNRKKWTIKWLINLSVIVKWNFLEDNKVQYHFYDAIKNYPFSKSVLKAERYWMSFFAVETSDCQFLLYL